MGDEEERKNWDLGWSVWYYANMQTHRHTYKITYQGAVEKEGDEEEDLAQAPKSSCDVPPGDACTAGNSDKEEVDGVHLFGKHHVGRQSLIESDEQHQVMRKTHCPEEDGRFSPSHKRCHFRTREIPHHGHVGRRISNFGETSFSSRQPLSIELQLQC